jgi:hypothetical protein
MPNLEHFKGINVKGSIDVIKRLLVTSFAIISWAHCYHSG